MQGVRSLLAHSFAPNEVMGFIKDYGNIAIALNKDLSQILTPIARTRLTGKLQGQEYNMMVDAGLNLGEATYNQQVAAGAFADTEENKKRFLARFRDFVISGNYTWEMMEAALKHQSRRV